MDRALYATGQRLGGTVYRVVKHLATGGMGSVFDVEDVTVGKRYVLKTLHPQLISRRDLAKRMEAEARTLAKLQHPNIVDVVTAGVTTDEYRVPFYVMERLNGQNLRVLLDKRGALELAHAYRIAIDVLDALEHAHENAVIHRDVKPENIFLHRNPSGTTTTKLLDFGIMRLLDRKSSHTQGKFIGTLRYASPEQILGGDLGPATDVYSLGVVLYEMICGRGPFDDAGDAYAIGSAHAHQTPPPPTTFAAISHSLSRLVLMALEKSPEARPRDAFTFARELRQLLRAEEAAPRSATAVNVISSVPQAPARTDGAAATTTEPSPGPALSAPPPTRRETPSPPLAFETVVDAPSSAHEGAAVAETVVDAHAMAAAGIDRNAPTRASAPLGQTQRMATNDTVMDLDGAIAGDDVVRAALSERAPLEVGPTSDPGLLRSTPDLVFPSTVSGATGPLAGEAPTRPPERGVLLPLLSAVALGVVLVGSAVVAIKRPWERYQIVDRAEATATASMPTASAIPGASEASEDGVVPVSAARATPPPNASAAAPSPAEPEMQPRIRQGGGGRPPPVAVGDGGLAPAGKAAPQPRTPPVRPPSGTPRPEEVGFE